jgi:uncharacterized protein (DUF1684 family)
MRPVLDWSTKSPEEDPLLRAYRSCPVLILLFAAVTTAIAVTYQSDVVNWRRNYETSLKKENGWLAVAGIFWLKEGQSRFGSDKSCEIVLPASAPPRAGNFDFRDGKVMLFADPRVEIRVNDKPRRSAELAPDTADAPDLVTLGTLGMQVIRRGERTGIRLWDNASAARQDFPGLGWFPVNEEYRIKADFTAYPERKTIPITNVLGDTEQTPSPGYAVFKLRGKEYRLEPIVDGSDLLFTFKDLTSGKQTYPAGRFLYASQPRDGSVVLDFNKATNPPCAYTPYATCPLPPKQNALSVRIEAGELNYKHAGKSH